MVQGLPLSFRIVIFLSAIIICWFVFSFLGLLASQAGSCIICGDYVNLPGRNEGLFRFRITCLFDLLCCSIFVSADMQCFILD